MSPTLRMIAGVVLVLLGGLWTLQATIFPENRASLNLHHAAGFRTLALRERIGRHHGVWRDTVLLERRRAVDPD